MEEDLKDLQKYISFANKSENFSHNSDWQWHKELAIEIENLIARNKELEEKLQDKTYKFLCDNPYIDTFDVRKVIMLEQVQKDYIPNERLIHYMDVALENSKQCLKKGNKIRANEEYKRYKDLKDIVDDLVYHKTLGKGDK